MKKVLLVLIFAHISLVQFGQIIADHTVVDKYDEIPQQYIDEVKKMLVTVAGMSHSFGYYTGAALLEKLDSRFRVYTTIDTEPLPLASDTALRLCRPWMTGETIWTSPSGIASAKTSQINYTPSNPYNAYIFGWSYQATWDNPPGGTIDPVYNVHWAGRTDGGLDGNRRWGLDSGDIILTGNRVSMDNYLEAWEEFITYCESNYPTTNMIFSTLIADGHGGTESGFQRELKSTHIRNYIDEDENEDKILFDFGDILTHNNSGEAYTSTWDDGGTPRTHPQIHPDNLMDYDDDWNIISPEPDPPGEEDHIGEVGALRVGKALWWMLARVAGWDGIANDIEDFADENSSFLIRVTDNEIRIELDDSFQFEKVSLLNLQGTVISDKLIDSNICKLNTVGLPIGVYLVVLTNSRAFETRKVVLW